MLYPLYDYYYASDMTLEEIMEHYIKSFYLRNYGSNKVEKVLRKVAESSKIQKLYDYSANLNKTPNFIDFGSVINEMLYFMFQSNKTHVLAILAAAIGWDKKANRLGFMKEECDFRNNIIKIFRHYSIYEEMTQQEFEKMTRSHCVKNQQQSTRQVNSVGLMDQAKKLTPQTDKKVFRWQDFKIKEPDLAADIEALTEKDMSKVSDIDASQIVTSLKRWSENVGCPINQLKDYFLKDSETFPDELNYILVVDQFKRERAEEAANFNISLDNTIAAFKLQWIQEKHQKEKESSMLNKILDSMKLDEDAKKHMYEKIQETVDTLAPDISGFDHEENRLLALAEEGVDYISSEYKQLSDTGRIEALIYCTTCLIDLPTNYRNELNLNKKEDRYFLLLHDKIMFNKCNNIDDVVAFINSRINFYKEQKQKLAESSMYTPMFIYNALYMNPLCEHPEILKEFKESPIEMFLMNTVLKRLNQFLTTKKLDII